MFYAHIYYTIFYAKNYREGPYCIIFIFLINQGYVQSSGRGNYKYYTIKNFFSNMNPTVYILCGIKYIFLVKFNIKS
jgi:hypothetical protein